MRRAPRSSRERGGAPLNATLSVSTAGKRARQLASRSPGRATSSDCPHEKPGDRRTVEHHPQIQADLPHFPGLDHPMEDRPCGLQVARLRELDVYLPGSTGMIAVLKNQSPVLRSLAVVTVAMDPALFDVEQAGEVGVETHFQGDRSGFLPVIRYHQPLPHPVADMAIPEHHHTGVGQPRSRRGQADEGCRERLLYGDRQRLRLVIVQPQLKPAQDPGIQKEQALGTSGRMAPVLVETQNVWPSTRVTSPAIVATEATGRWCPSRLTRSRSGGRAAQRRPGSLFDQAPEQIQVVLHHSVCGKSLLRRPAAGSTIQSVARKMSRANWSSLSEI